MFKEMATGQPVDPYQFRQVEQNGTGLSPVGIMSKGMLKDGREVLREITRSLEDSSEVAHMPRFEDVVRSLNTSDRALFFFAQAAIPLASLLPELVSKWLF